MSRQLSMWWVRNRAPAANGVPTLLPVELNMPRLHSKRPWQIPTTQLTGLNLCPAVRPPRLLLGGQPVALRFVLPRAYPLPAPGPGPGPVHRQGGAKSGAGGDGGAESGAGGAETRAAAAQAQGGIGVQGLCTLRA